MLHKEYFLTRLQKKKKKVDYTFFLHVLHFMDMD